MKNNPDPTLFSPNTVPSFLFDIKYLIYLSGFDRVADPVGVDPNLDPTPGPHPDYKSGLASKNPTPKKLKSKDEKTHLKCFFFFFILRFFIVNHLVDYLILTLNISLHFKNMNHLLKTYFIAIYIDKIEREKI